MREATGNVEGKQKLKANLEKNHRRLRLAQVADRIR
jgi:hypothetical protein